MQAQTVDKERLIALLEPAVAALGYELTDIDAHAGRRGLLRVYIDNEAGVTLADCERVSDQLGAFLDVEDPLPGSYVLEVSSPGFDRRLRTEEHFRRFVERLVKVELREPQDGRRRLTGRLVAADGEAIVVDVEGTEWRIGLSEIAVARLVPKE
jgi:ribosome maturation factor RimP